jgi:hypothetical protein
MAFCLSAAYLILRANKFSGIASAAFTFSLALGPWVIVFARNLYWVQFTWFLPSLVTALSASSVSRVGINNRGRVINYLLLVPTLFCVVLAKLLCGYEYITTIFLASLAVFVSLSYRSCVRKSVIIRGSLIIILVFGLAFGSAVGMHASQLRSLGKPGLQTIWITAAKRASSTTPASLAEKACTTFKDPEKLERCRDSYAKSLLSNPIQVAYRYIYIPSFLPWIGHDVDPYELQESHRSSLRQIREDLKSARIQDAFNRFTLLPPKVMAIACRRVASSVINRAQKLVFPAFVVLAFLAFRRDFLAILALGSFFVGSASWFFAENGDRNSTRMNSSHEYR